MSARLGTHAVVSGFLTGTEMGVKKQEKKGDGRGMGEVPHS